MVKGNASRMGLQRALLARALRKAELDTFEGGRTAGRLDRRAGSRLLAGSPAVFGKRTISEGYDTDVEILIDGSSSMRGQAATAAASLALVIAQAASQVGVDCFAHVFGDTGLQEVTAGKRKPDVKLFGYAAIKPTGGTPLTENLIRVAHMQAARAQGKRRIIFVVTDGMCDRGTPVVRAAGEYLEDCMGVEIANLHIGSQGFKAFRNEVAVRPWDVVTTGLKSMTSMLERGA
jgi:cobalamin biosynthesis protein CobT